MISEDTPLSTTDVNGQAIIHQIACSGNMNLLKKIIFLKADIYQCDQNNKNSLHYAVYGNQLDTLKHLLNQNIFANQKDRTGKTPLLEAVEQDNKNAVEILLQHGVNIYLKNNDGENALMIASKKNNLEIMELLLKNYRLKENYIKSLFHKENLIYLNYRPMSKHIMNAMNTNDLNQLCFNLFYNNQKKIKSLINTHFFNTEEVYINYGLLNLSVLFFNNFLDYNHIIAFIQSNPIHLKNVFLYESMFNSLNQIIKIMKQKYSDKRIIELLSNINTTEDFLDLEQICFIYFLTIYWTIS